MNAHRHAIIIAILCAFIASLVGFVLIHVVMNDPVTILYFFGLIVNKYVVFDIGFILLGAVIVILLFIVLEDVTQ
jgi:hypothetical protein